MLPQHEVISRYEGRHVRLKVLVEEPWVSRDQLEELTEVLAERTNAERIDYFDFEELITAKPTLGFWEKYGVTALRKKDWQKRPVPHDVQLWVELNSMRAGNKNGARELAAKHRLTVDMVKADIARVRDWIANADARTHFGSR